MKQRESGNHTTDLLARKKTTFRIRLAIAGIQTNDSQNALEIVIAVVLDFDAAAFGSMMNHDVGPQMLTQFVLQISDGG
jgi:hypothetical protein